MLRTPRPCHDRTTSAGHHLPLVVVLLAALALASFPAPAASAGIFVVDRGDDSNPPAQACTAAANDCSLRGAILAANAQPDLDTISLPTGTYALSIIGDDDNAQTGDLDITEDLAITGASASATIVDAESIDRVFDIIGGSVTIVNITIRDGLAATNGGALYNRSSGDLTLTDSILAGNAADAGGGIYNQGILALTENMIAGNLAGFGGGVYNTGTLRVSASAIVSNTANTMLAPSGGVGGGLYNNGVLGGAAALAVVNSTISGNRATIHGGGVYNIQGTVRLYNATIAHNTADSDTNTTGMGGGIIQIPGSGMVSLRNTLVAQNTGGSAPDCSGALVSQGYSLIQTTTGCTISAGAGDITGQNPKIGPLRNNGGPTLTHALLSGSPALNAGNPGGCKDDLENLLTSDQRGFPRPQSGCDIGAYERSAGPPPPAISKAFGSSTIDVGGRTALIFTITNPATMTITLLAFKDRMPAALTVAPHLPQPIQNTCGGTLSMPIGASTISLTGGSVAAGATCTIRLYVTSTTAGSHANTADPASAAEVGAGAPSNTATLTVTQLSYRVSLPMIRK